MSTFIARDGKLVPSGSTYVVGNPLASNLTLRDLAALHAFQGMLSGINGPDKRDIENMERVVETAFDYAQLFMEEYVRRKKGE